MDAPDYRRPRRLFLAQSALIAGAAVVGCTKSKERPKQTVPASTSSVPLRILLFSDTATSDSLQRGWSASHESEIQVEVVPFDRATAKSLSDQLASRVTQSDVIIHPSIAIGELVTQSAIVPIDWEEVASSSSGEDGDAWIMAPAIRSGLAKFAGQSTSLPLGGKLPGIFSVDSTDPINDWAAYDSLVSGPWSGAAAEPNAPGWAGIMFLWRAMATASDKWLLDRESLDAVIATQPYVDCLSQMLETHSRYDAPRRTPEDIWAGITSGTLKGGVVLPPARVEAFPEIQFQPLPKAEGTSRVLFDPWTPVASLSSTCRQTTRAREFLSWLITPDGTNSLKLAVGGVTPAIEPAMRDGAHDSTTDSPYDAWLDSQWASPLAMPSFTILRGSEYFEVLDVAIGETLDGEKLPGEALDEVAGKWDAITQSVGVKAQTRVWSQAQGLRG